MPLNRTDDEEGLNLPSPITRKYPESPMDVPFLKVAARVVGFRWRDIGGGGTWAAGCIVDSLLSSWTYT